MPVLYALCAVNLLAFVLMGVDKRRAERGQWRVSEKALFLPAVFGGAPGAFLGMQLFRHKTRHWYFRYGMPALILLEYGAALWFFVLRQ